MTSTLRTFILGVLLLLTTNSVTQAAEPGSERRRLHRQLYRAEDDGSGALRNDAASGRIRDVLLAVIFRGGFPAKVRLKNAKGAPMGRLLFFGPLRMSNYIRQSATKLKEAV
jgi:hypothetical protein